MVEQTFSINNAWSIDPPCYVRKVDRSGHWQDTSAIRDKVFCPEPDNTISVYVVNCAIDLARVAIALNANRSSKIEPIFLVAMTASELAGVVVQRTEGATLCKWANHLHHDLVVTDSSRILSLAQTLMVVGRKPYKFTKKAMQEALDATAKDGCHAANQNSDGCVCNHDLIASRSAPWLVWLGQAVGRAKAWIFGRTVHPMQ